MFLNINKSLTSNHTSFFMLPEVIKRLLLKKKKVVVDVINYKYIQQYVTNFISHYSSLKSLFILQTNVSRFTNDGVVGYKEIIQGLVFYFSKLNKKYFRNFDLNFFMEIFIFTLFKKDLNYFIKFFKNELEEMSLKKHKRVLYSFEFLLKKFFSKFFFYAKVAGLKFEISGKISVTGNSKTRNKIIKYGQYSFTNKSLCIDYIYDIIRTTTGVMGFRMFITY